MKTFRPRSFPFRFEYSTPLKSEITPAAESQRNCVFAGNTGEKVSDPPALTRKLPGWRVLSLLYTASCFWGPADGQSAVFPLT